MWSRARLLLVISICAFVSCVAMVPRRAAADLPRVASVELPRHAIDVLGDDRFTCTASEVFYQDDEHVLAVCGKTATRFEAATGRRKDLQTDAGIFLGPTCLLRGGDRWVFGTTWKKNESVVEIWDMSFKQPRREIKQPEKKQALALSGDGKFLAILETKYDDLSIEIVNVENGQATDRVPGPEHILGNSQHNPRAWFARGGRVLVVSHTLQQNGKYQLDVRFFPLSNEGKLGEPISTMELPGFNGQWRLLPTRDDDHILAVGNDAILHNFATGKTTASVKFRGSAFSAAVNRDLSVLAVCGNSGEICLWDVATQKLLRRIETKQGSIRSVNFSPDDQMLVGAGPGRIHFWDVRTGLEVHGGSNPSFGAPKAIAVSPDMDFVAVADRRGRAQLWNLKTRKRIDLEDNPVRARGGFDPWPGPNFLAMSKDGSRLVGGSNNAHNVVNVWDTASGRRLMKIAGHRWPIMGVAISADGTKMASTSRDSTVRVVDSDGKLLHTFADASASVAFFPDGNRIVACHAHGKGDGLRVFNLQTGKLEKELHAPREKRSPWAYSVAVSPDGNRIASIHRDGVVRLWDLGHDRPTREIALRQDGPQSGHTTGCAAFSPDGKTLAASAGTEAIFLCDVRSGRVKAELVGHRKYATSFAFDKSGDVLASASPDYRVIIWGVRRALAADEPADTE